MSAERSEIRIPLPRNPVLRTLTLYGIGGLLFLMLLPALLRALALPAWIGPLGVLLVILAAPVVALGAWLAYRPSRV